MRRYNYLFLSLLVLLSSCIKNDFLDDATEPKLQLTTKLDSLALFSNFQFTAIYFNNIGLPEIVPLEWSSSNPEIINIDNAGLATALEIGSSEISVFYNDQQNGLMDTKNVIVGNNTVESVGIRSGKVASTSSYKLSGDFTLSAINNRLKLEFADNYTASTSLPGLYIYLSNNRNSSANAYEIGPVQIFDGAHDYTINNVGIDDYNYVLFYCKPFNVKVGDGEIQ